MAASTSVCSMVGGAKVIMGTTAGPSAPRSKMALSSSKTKWIPAAFISYSRIRSSRFITPSPTANFRWPGSSSCANRSAVSRPFSILIAWSRNIPSGFMRRRRRLTASFRKTIALRPAISASGKRVFAKIGRRFKIDDIQVGNKDRQNIPVGESLEVSARVHLGAVDPQHVRVEAYHGEAENGGIKNPAITTLNQAGQNGDGTYLYRGSVPASESGAYGFSIRVLPTHPHLQQEHELRLITWS